MGGRVMKTSIGALAGLLLAGMAWMPSAQAQGTWPGYNTYSTPSPYAAPRYVEPRREPGYGSRMRERCVGLHREAEMLRHRLHRGWNPGGGAPTAGGLRGGRGAAGGVR